MTDSTAQQAGITLPLAGIKVVEIAQNLAGPYASEILATLGADVVKIERPEGGDDARGWGPPFWEDPATSFHTMNRNKRGITLDLKDPAAIAWLKDFLSDADVLIQNLRPGTMEEMGLGADIVRKLNPRLVYCSVWAYGHTGPMKLHPGYEPMMQAFAGLFSVNGPETGPTARIGVQVLDLGTGVWTALGCIAALLRRQTTGLGGEVDTSLFETALGWLNVHLAAFSVTQTQPERHRSGNAKVVVFQSFETRDGEVVIAAANDRLFAKLAKEVGFPQWASDPRFASNALRVQHKADILGPMAEVLRSDTTAHWLERLEAIGVPCAPIHDLQDVVEQPQTAAIGMLQRVPGTGLDVVGLPVSFEGVRPSIRRRAPALGEHNQEVGAPPARTQKGAS